MHNPALASMLPANLIPMPFARYLLLPLLVLSSLYSAASDMLEVELVGANASHRFQVEVADDAASRARGLMHRTLLPRDEGMLFLFEAPSKVAFWMRNTLIPLDILFIREDRVIHIHHDAQPHDETHIVAPEPVDQVLEINGGLARELGIAAGDRLRRQPSE